MTTPMHNDDEHTFFRGKETAPAYLFVHGYGSATQDLIPLATHINAQGNNCAILRLHGHGRKAEELVGLRYTDWLDQLRELHSHYRTLFPEVYLVGFSLGATLCLQLATETRVAGVVAISTFLKPPRTTHCLAKLIGAVRVAKYYPRILQVTDQRTKKQLSYYRYLPVQETLTLISDVAQASPHLASVQCPVLFFHSVNDRVSDYWEVVAYAETLAHDDTCLVNFRHLGHFVHFDVPLPLFYNVVTAFFETYKAGETRQMDDNFEESLRDASEYASAELRHWSDILFRLIVGFFTIFGALLYYSLPKVLEGDPGTPYYLLAYSILTSTFLIMASLYFFYVNRVNVFMKHHIEPYLPCASWAAFRTSTYLGGKESRRMTSSLSLATVLPAAAISLGSLGYAVVQYRHRFFSFGSDDILLFAIAVVAVMLILRAIASGRALSRYTERELYRIPAPRRSFAHLQRPIQTLCLSVNPGVVVQPEEHK